MKSTRTLALAVCLCLPLQLSAGPAPGTVTDPDNDAFPSDNPAPFPDLVSASGVRAFVEATKEGTGCCLLQKPCLHNGIVAR